MSKRTLRSMRVQIEALRAHFEATLANLDDMLADEDAPSAGDVVNVDDHAKMTGCTARKAREFFARAEREGFAVQRVGRAVFMARAEWMRAVEQLRAQRRARPAPATPPPSNATTADALLDAVGAVPTTPRARSARR